jgi:hypothetical protein
MEIVDYATIEPPQGRNAGPAGQLVGKGAG